ILPGRLARTIKAGHILAHFPSAPCRHIIAGLQRQSENRVDISVRKPFLQLVSERVVVLDGSMGANLQARTFELTRDWRGHENCCEMLNLSRPDEIQSVHESFLEVGCDGVETNTFNGSRADLAE